jgi:uncharacterized YigZ family protein
LIIEKSRFIGRICEVVSKDAADRFFAEIRKTHRTATHNVPAFVIGENMQHQWASDDGEPQGTSGAPILRMLTAGNITNVAVMITRYFGGIKLGTGGLARAYTAAAKAALDVAGTVDVEDGVRFRYAVDYPHLGKLKVLAERNGFLLNEIVCAEQVLLTLTVRKEDEARARSCVTGLTGGAERLMEREDCDIRL